MIVPKTAMFLEENELEEEEDNNEEPNIEKESNPEEFINEEPNIEKESNPEDSNIEHVKSDTVILEPITKKKRKYNRKKK